MAVTGDETARQRIRRRSLTGRLLLPRGPQRKLATATFVNALGSGMFMSASVLYFTRVVQLPEAQVAMGLSAGAMVGLAAGLMGGRIADRWGARETQIVILLLGTLVMCGYLLVDAFWSYLLASVMIGIVFAMTKASMAPLIRRFGGDDPASFRAYLRATMNLAVSLGAVAAGVAIQFDTAPAYLVVMSGRAVSFLGCALLLWRLPRLAPLPVPPMRDRWQALRDRPYLAATALNCLMSLHLAIPTFLLPLWIVDHTSAPGWMVSGVLILNTILVVTLQVAVSRGVNDTPSAGRRMRWAGVAIATGLWLMLSAGQPSIWISVALLLVAMAVYTLGELWHAAASMEYSFGLAVPHAQEDSTPGCSASASVSPRPWRPCSWPRSPSVWADPAGS